MNKSEELISEIRNKTKAPTFKEIPDVEHMLCPTKEYLVTLTADHCFTNCMHLMSYKMSLQDALNKIHAQKNMLQKYLNQQYAQHWKDAPDMLPKDVHYAYLYNNNPKIRPCVKHLNILELYIQESEGRIHDVLKLVGLYENKGKAIQWGK